MNASVLTLACNQAKERLESELKLHWQRIQIASVVLVALYSATGYQFVQASGGSLLRKHLFMKVTDAARTQPADLVLLLSVLATIGVSWYITVLVISGSFWIRVNEQKLEVIERELFGFSLYSDHVAWAERPYSLTAFTTYIYAVPCFMLIVATVSYVLSSYVLHVARPCDEEILVIVLVISIVIALLIATVWWMLVVSNPRKLVYGRSSSPSQQLLIDQEGLKRAVSSLVHKPTESGH